jgi:hypothetical protein
MKKLIFTLFTLIAVQAAFSQTTYYWVGGTSPAAGAWNVGTNWNTALNGSGTARSTSVATDNLVFDGSNVGGSAPATGAVSVSLTSQTIGKLILQNNADVALSRNGSGGTTTLTIGDDPSGNDLVVFSGCTLRLKGLTGSMLIVLFSDAGPSNSPPATTSATALIYGNIILEEGNSTYQNRFTSRYKGAFVFTNGSSLRALAAYQYYPFGTSGSSTTPIAEGVVFESGSSYYYEGGLSPFGSNSTSFHVRFDPGSIFYFRAVPAANMFGSRSYADVVVENSATVTANGSLIKIDNFTVAAGATYITHTSGVTPIHGNIVVNGTLKVPDANPDRDNKIIISGSTAQTLSGTGTYSLADIVISNISSLTLQKAIVVDTITRVIGTLNPNGFTITGAGTISSKSPASVNISGNLNVDSFIVKNITDLTGIEAGMSVSGTNIPANTIVTNTSSSSGTITLSKAVTGSVTYASAATALTVFNNQGTVLPLRFGDVVANLNDGKTYINWKMYVEQDVIKYDIERSINGVEFNAIGSVAPGNNDYKFIDASPQKGNNFYRIKAVSRDGQARYSNILKVNNTRGKQEMSVYPNPVIGKSFSISLNGLSEGLYNLTLINLQGQQVMSKSVGYVQNNFNASISLSNNITPGLYTLVISSNDNQLKQSILIK